MINKTHTCVSCGASRFEDGDIIGHCGDPCSFIMGKGGSASPEWGTTAEGRRPVPSEPDMSLEAPFLHLIKGSAK